MLFDAHRVAGQILSAWDAAPMLQLCVRPDPLALWRLLESAFLASMHTDEGRAVKFALLLRQNDRPDDGEYTFVRFSEHRPLTTSELGRLAPATGLSPVLIAVEDRGGELSIWGIMDAGTRWAAMQNAEQTDGISLPLEFIVMVSGPGTLVVKFSDFELYRTERGQSLEPGLNVFKAGPVHQFFRQVMVDLLQEAFPDRPADSFDPFFVISCGGEYLRFLVRTLRYVVEFSHGGTLFITSRQDASALAGLVSIKYPLTGFRIWDLLVRHLRGTYASLEAFKALEGSGPVDRSAFNAWRAAEETHADLENQIIDRSRLIARFTQVDGAVMLTDRLDVLGFGAVINTVSGRRTVRLCHDESCSCFLDTRLETFGTRHRSAVGLCERTDTVAFVVSSDGGVKVVRKQGDEILLWNSVALEPKAWFVTDEDVIPDLRNRAKLRIR